MAIPLINLKPINSKAIPKATYKIISLNVKVMTSNKWEHENSQDQVIDQNCLDIFRCGLRVFEYNADDPDDQDLEQEYDNIDAQKVRKKQEVFNPSEVPEVIIHCLVDEQRDGDNINRQKRDETLVAVHGAFADKLECCRSFEDGRDRRALAFSHNKTG